MGRSNFNNHLTSRHCLINCEKEKTIKKEKETRALPKNWSLSNFKLLYQCLVWCDLKALSFWTALGHPQTLPATFVNDWCAFNRGWSPPWKPIENKSRSNEAPHYTYKVKKFYSNKYWPTFKLTIRLTTRLINMFKIVSITLFMYRGKIAAQTYDKGMFMWQRHNGRSRK